MEDYEANHKDDDEKKSESGGGTKRKAESDTKSSKPTKKQDTRPKGFARGLTAEKTIGATNVPENCIFSLSGE